MIAVEELWNDLAFGPNDTCTPWSLVFPFLCRQTNTFAKDVSKMPYIALDDEVHHAFESQSKNLELSLCFSVVCAMLGGKVGMIGVGRNDDAVPSLHDLCCAGL
eukprot:Gb_27846 [translate_table: standard]